MKSRYAPQPHMVSKAKKKTLWYLCKELKVQLTQSLSYSRPIDIRHSETGEVAGSRFGLCSLNCHEAGRGLARCCEARWIPKYAGEHAAREIAAWKVDTIHHHFRKRSLGGYNVTDPLQTSDSRIRSSPDCVDAGMCLLLLVLLLLWQPQNQTGIDCASGHHLMCQMLFDVLLMMMLCLIVGDASRAWAHPQTPCRRLVERSRASVLALEQRLAETLNRRFHALAVAAVFSGGFVPVAESARSAVGMILKSVFVQHSERWGWLCE